MIRTPQYTGWFTTDHDGNDELEVYVTFSFKPVIPATYGQPAEGGEIELLSAVTRAGLDIIDQMTSAAHDRITDWIATYPEDYADQVGPDADYLRDMRMERAA